MGRRYLIAETPEGEGVEGLSPAFVTFIHADGSDPGDAPAITEIGGGFYYFTFEPDQDLAFRVDLDPGGGAALAARFARDVLSPDDDAITEERMLLLLAATTRGRSRIKNPVFTEAGKLASATLAFYRTSEDAEDDSSPLFEVAVSATYSEEAELATFLGVEAP